MLTPSKAAPKFDPAAPVPHRTLSNIMATGVGQAASHKLYSCAIGGAVGALVILVAAPSLWVGATPFVCVSCLGTWGLATKRRYVIDLQRDRAPLLRLALDVVRGVTLLVGVTAALAALARVLIVLMSPGWVL
jgi:hypothetical protein